MSKLIRLRAALPAVVRRDAVHVLLAFGAAFVASARPALPALLHTPSLAAARAAALSILAAGVVAGARVAAPLLALYLGKAAEALVRRYGKRLHVDIRVTDLPQFEQALADLQSRLLAELEQRLHKTPSRP